MGRRIKITAALLIAAGMLIGLAGCEDLGLLTTIRGMVDETYGAGDTIYVSADASGDDNTGYTPEDPLNDIARAVDVAASVGASEVAVAEGTYMIDADNIINMRPGVSLKGGYLYDFSESDPTAYISTVRCETMMDEALVEARGAEIQDITVEGFRFELVIDGELNEDTHFQAISLGDGPSANIRNNTFRMDLTLTGDYSTIFSAVSLCTNAGEPDQYNFEVYNNDILIVVSREVPGSWSDPTAIDFHGIGSGSEVKIHANKIVLLNKSDWGANGIHPGGEGIQILNNVIHVVGQGNASGIGTRSDVSAEIGHNTIIVSDQAGGSAEALAFRGTSQNSTLAIVNNILGSPDEGGTGLLFEHSGSCAYEYSLCFGFTDETSGSAITTKDNDHELLNIFSDVFSSGYDADLSDGDETDYHLDDTGSSTYAVDRGSVGPWNTDVDFEGDSRPQGSAVDRGADEKVQ